MELVAIAALLGLASHLGDIHADETAPAAQVRKQRLPGTRSPQYKQLQRHVEQQSLPQAVKERTLDAARKLIASTRAHQRTLSVIPYREPLASAPDIVRLVARRRAGVDEVSSGLDAVSSNGAHVGNFMALRLPLLRGGLVQAEAGRYTLMNAEAPEKGVRELYEAEFDGLVGHRFEGSPFIEQLMRVLARSMGPRPPH